MIKFRPINQEESSIISDIIKYLKDDRQRFKVIDKSEAESVAGLNSKQMVLVSAKSTASGSFSITLMDKNSISSGKVYPYTEKLVGKILNLKITNIDNTITAESDYKGIILDAVDILARKYQLSIVKDN